MFVRARQGEYTCLGVGKLIDRRGDLCTVEYFEAPVARPVIHDISADLLAPVTLPEQTRVYFFNNQLGFWEIGRLLDDHGDTQYVRFPNGSDRWLKVNDTFVRWSKPIAEPTAFLAGKVNETPRFADGRSAFVKSLLAQRAAAMGMSALVSSAVELESHQIEIVRRVLQDPVQRYLLADEVGLGKTIEAGVLIRQCVLDCGDDARILVIVPSTLVAQWRRELSSKFFLEHCLDNTVHILSFGEVERIKELLNYVDMLVVDEAHHLTSGRSAVDPHLYNVIAHAAPAIERVLLLSATPALHNERGFLEMLHLLDPHTYRQDDEEGFRRRIESRQELAQSVASLTPENALYLDYTLDRLTERFPDDALLLEQVSALRAIIDLMPADDDPELIQAIGRVRSHLSEVYRLHRRILRHRRRSIGGLTPDRSGATRVTYRSPVVARLYDAIEDWRFGEVTSTSGGEETLQQDRGRTLAQVLDDMAQYPSRRAKTIAAVTGQEQPFDDADHFAKIVQGLGSQEAFEARSEALIQAVKPLLRPKQQFVVFCSDSVTADALVPILTAELQVQVDRHDPDHDEWLAFNSDPTRTVLVCDRRAEEGLNLQGGRKIIVHYDLPFNANRVEQRLGRADRYGSGDSIKSLIVECLDNPFETAWIDYLDKGLRVFDRSVASLQYLIEDMVRELPSALFSEGVEAIVDLTSKSEGENGMIENEIKAIDQQDALDALGAPPADTLEAIAEIDDDWQAIERYASGWIETNLLFARSTENGTQNGDKADATPFRYRYVTSNPHTLIPLETFIANCLSDVDQSGASHLLRQVRTQPLTYRRRTALSRDGRKVGVRLLRYGTPFVTGMWTITQADDRGRSTAVWRFMPDYQADGPADLFFRFDFVVEADMSEALRVLEEAGRSARAARAAVARRADMALAPFVQTIWLDQELARVDNPTLLAKLQLPYRPLASGQGGRDFNLNPQRWLQLVSLRLPSLDAWPEICWAARERAETYLRQEPLFVEALSLAAHRVAAVDSNRLGQLRARAEMRNDAADKAEWALEVALSKAIRQGVQAPQVRVDGVLACFLSNDQRATARIATRGGT